VLVRQGHYVEAVEHYHEALRLRPDYALAHRNLGAVLAHQGDVQAAIREYREAMRLDPGDTRARVLLETSLAAQEAAEPRP
jgi:Flp pilus assembly protein TadD